MSSQELIRGLQNDFNKDNKGIVIPTEWPINEIKRADKEILRAAREIRLYYYKQLHLLRQLPYLALESDGRGGWDDESSRAYNDYLMAIHQQGETFNGDEDGSYDLFIELRTGMLVGANQPESHCIITPDFTTRLDGDTSWNLANDHEVFVKLAHQDKRDRFNPAREAARFKKQMSRPYHNSKECVNEWLEEKDQIKIQIDRAMAELPIEKVISVLRNQGFNL